MKIITGGAALTVIILCFIFSGCTKDKTANTNCTGCADTLSFHADILPIFLQNCAIGGCHSAADSSDQPIRIRLDSAAAYTQATQPGTGYINAGNPTTSVLLSQLYAGAGEHMPQNGQLDDCTIQKIYCWIQQGAKNN